MFENKEGIKRKIKEYQNSYMLGEFDFVTMTFKECANNQHHFVDLKHYRGGSDCRCKKCNLVVGFNRGWPERIQADEWQAFVNKYRGSKFDFYYSPDDFR